MNLNSLAFRTFDPTLPEPISFNSWKHHLGFIHSCTKKVETEDSSILVQYQDLINSIGGTLVDIYVGDLTTTQISNEVLKTLSEANITDKNACYQWISAEGKAYRCIYLSDSSKWTVRLGKYENRFVHIHPGRYSNNTIRVKSTTLKTAIAYMFMYGPSRECFSIDNINFARQNLALLPPMKPTSSLTPVSNLLRKFFP